jgi:ATP-dependent DNA helicase RecQ
MQRNEEMRVIAVGDDDQNIYAFRGSDSKYLHSLVVDHNATLYEMTDNYRSAQEIVNHANRFVRRIPNRMKHTPIKAVTTDKGVVKTIPTDAKFVIQRSAINGSTAILTRTNEQALQVAYQLEQHGIRALLVQSGSGFRFINLAEVRYFVKYLGDDGSVISKDVWETAKERTCQNYATSRLLPAMKHFWEDYEQINRTIYRSDLHQFLLESDVEDFVSFDNNCVFVSTIHKAKGREFDTAHLFVSEPDTTDPDDLRTIYVGLTRARRNLYIYNKPVLDQTNISISLNLHDVWLDYFKERKDKVLRLRSGDGLKYSNGYLISQQGDYIACLSKARKQQMEELYQKGYHVISVQVSYILAWRPREEPQEVAVCLANIILQK